MPTAVILNREYPQTKVVAFHAPHAHSWESRQEHAQFVPELQFPHGHESLPQILHALLQQLHLACDLLHYRDAREYVKSSPLKSALLSQQHQAKKNAETKKGQHTVQTRELVLRR